MVDNVIRGRFGGTAGEARKQGDIEPIRSPTPGDLPALERKIAALKGGKLDLADRETVARNLGRIFDRLPKGGVRSGVLSKAGLSEAGDHTKRLPRVAIMPWMPADRIRVKELTPRYDAYRRVAVAAKEALGEDPELVEFELVAGSSLDPLSDCSAPGLTPDERTVYDSLADLHDMLTLAVGGVARRRNLRRYFNAIARWRLVSGNGGKTFRIDDQPCEPADDIWFWQARIDLLPTAQLFRGPVEDTGQTAAVSDASGQPRFRAPLHKQRLVSIGIAPIGASGSPVPVLVESEELVLVMESSFLWLAQDAAGLRDDPSSLVTCSVQPVASVRPLTRRGLFDALGRRVDDEPFELSDLLDPNPLIVVHSEGASRAVAGTIASFIERALRYREADDPWRPDRMLDEDAAEKIASLDQCLAEVELELDESMRRFRAGWEE